MPATRRQLGLAAAALALMLPSCIESRIGACIRHSGLVYTGVDVRHPEGGLFFQTPAQREAHEAYVFAPEYTYRLEEPLFCSYDIQGTESQPRPTGLRPTGQHRLVLAYCVNGCPWYFKESAAGLPEDAQASVSSCYGTPDPTDDRPDPTPAWWRYAAAAPFDYLIDPALTLTLTLGGAAVDLVATPLVFL